MTSREGQYLPALKGVGLITTNLPAGLAETVERLFILSSIHRLGTVFRRLRCHIGVMATYVVTQDGAFFAVKLGDSSGPVLATFSNRMAAERFAEKKRLKDQDSARQG